MDVERLAKNLHPLERKVVPFLALAKSLQELMKETGMSEVEVMRALQWLSNKKVLSLHPKESTTISLGHNGRIYKEKGLPEKRFLHVIREKDLSLSEVMERAELDKNEINIAMGLLKRKNAITFKKEKELVFSLTKEGESLLEEETEEELFLKKDFPLDPTALENSEKEVYKQLSKRKDMLSLEKKKDWDVKLSELGESLTQVKISGEDILDRLTSSLIKSGNWKGKHFREYDVSINVPPIFGGKRHFVSQAIDYIKKIWLDMGFTEMTGNLVQTSFWDLDALFVPQDHPARQMQDTFYIKDPKKGRLPDFWEKIKDVHENGGTTKSKGWGGSWSEEKAKELLLRTHTTVLSAHELSKLKKAEMPAKFFSVGKVFRNEALDYKHLFEFYQVDGIVVDPQLDFSHLKGYLREFFTKMGYADVRIRPAHFPYTEPSAEVEVLHPTRNEWIELGGSGIFRPEVTKPLLGEEIPVLAWGLGMGRIISEYWNVNDIRELYKNDLKQIRDMKYFMK